MTYHRVTAENIDAVREDMAAGDQKKEIEPGCETWAIFYEPGCQRGQMTVWPYKGRAAVAFGADSQWGDWDPNVRTLHLDEPDADGNTIVYDASGDRIPADPDCG